MRVDQVRCWDLELHLKEEMAEACCVYVVVVGEKYSSPDAPFMGSNCSGKLIEATSSWLCKSKQENMKEKAVDLFNIYVLN